MNEQQNIQDIVKQALESMQGQQATSWQGQTFSITPEVQKVNIPIKLQTAQGSLRVYLEFDASWGATAQKLQELVDVLDNMGFPLDTWQSKSSGWGNNNQQYNNYSGYKRSYRRY